MCLHHDERSRSRCNLCVQNMSLLGSVFGFDELASDMMDGLVEEICRK